MDVLQNSVTAIRKAKNDARVSFKLNPFCVHLSVSLHESICLLLGDAAYIVAKLTRASDIYIERRGWDNPFVLTDLSDQYPFFAGGVDLDGISATLFTKNNPWEN